MAAAAFLSLPAPAPRRPRLHCDPRAAARPPSDQYSQYAARDEAALAAELARARAAAAHRRHHHVFLHPAATPAFRAAATRFAAGHHAPLWLLRSAPDPTFGALRGPPDPARAALLEPRPSSQDAPVARWVAALDRTGPALAPYPSHAVDWAVCARLDRHGAERRAPAGDDVVAFELLNADWGRRGAMSQMRERLLQHAERVVTEGEALVFEVLQSVDEPTCFKTVELYPALDALQAHMAALDPPFAEGMLECRAAVNRVRQLYVPLLPDAL